MTATPIDLAIHAADEINACAEVLQDDGPSESAYDSATHARVVESLDVVAGALQVPGVLNLLVEINIAYSTLRHHIERCGEPDDPRAASPQSVMEYAWECISHVTDDDTDEIADAIRTLNRISPPTRLPY